MCQFIETIRIQSGHPGNLPFHQQRMLNTARRFHFHAPIAALDHIISQLTPPAETSKLRIVYGPQGITEHSCTPYTPRKIETLRLVDAPLIDYTCKYLDRTPLDRLKTTNTTTPSDTEEIIILQNGLITDTTYTNLAFSDGHSWFTPRTPLLPGTMRASLLARRLLIPLDIRPSHLSQFLHVSLFNSMLNLGQIILPIHSILPASK